ncbi:MAG: hypothetical protein OSB41_05930 [Kiritimatiellae bacterium]|nr:hypothetical protein [Kiritimatiellia bacterium]
MAHSSLHFAIGMTVGSVVTVPRLLAAWRHRAPLAPHFKHWLLASYAAGTFAIIPGLLRRLGADNAFCDGWWMNVFLFYPAINSVKDGGMTMGPLLMGGILGLQYLSLIAVLAWRLRQNQRQHVID